MTIRLWNRLFLTAPARPGSSIRLTERAVLCIALVLLASQSVTAQRFKPFRMDNLEGDTMTLDQFLDKATLVAFFYPTCPYCNLAFPGTVEIYEKYRDEGLSMVWINVFREEEDQVEEWMAENKFDVPVLVGASLRSLQRDYDVEVTPDHVLLDSEGRILFRQLGYLEDQGYEEELEAEVRKALGLEP